MIRVHKDSQLYETKRQKSDPLEEKSQPPSTSQSEKLKKKPKVFSEGIYMKGDMVGDFKITPEGKRVGEKFKITSEGKVHTKYVTYDVVAMKDVAFKKVKLRLR